MWITERELIPDGQPTGERKLARSGSPTFFGSQQILDLSQLHAQIGLLGVPFDQGTNDRPGSRFAPLAIRDASMRFRDGIKGGWIDIETKKHILETATMADCGDVFVRSVDMAENFDTITTLVQQIRGAGALPVLVGGDHSITYPAVRAYQGERIAIIHFDAHLDFTDEWNGVRFSHDNPLRRAAELPHVAGLVQIGIRGLERPSVYHDAVKFGSHIVPAEEYIRIGAEAAIERCPKADGYYVTVDIDVLDPAVAPGTGYPEAGGLSYYQLKAGLLAAARRSPIVGFDLVEVNPLFDQATTTSRLAARLILDFLGSVKLPVLAKVTD